MTYLLTSLGIQLLLTLIATLVVHWLMHRAALARPRLPAPPAGGLTKREIQIVLASVGDDEMLWRIVHQFIEVQRAEARDQALDADAQAQPQLLAYYNGADAHLRLFQNFLLMEREAAQKLMEEVD